MRPIGCLLMVVAALGACGGTGLMVDEGGTADTLVTAVDQTVLPMDAAIAIADLTPPPETDLTLVPADDLAVTPVADSTVAEADLATEPDFTSQPPPPDWTSSPPPDLTGRAADLTTRPPDLRSPPRDLSLPLDLASRDLSAVVDAKSSDGAIAKDASVRDAGSDANDAASDLTMTGGFCAGTPVAGTCVQAFFAPASSCFQPAGACVRNLANSVCWSNSASVVVLPKGSPYDGHITFADSGVTCMEGDFVSQMGMTLISTFTLKRGGATIVYSPETGAATCPDGTKINAGRCAALTALLYANHFAMGCQSGNCP